MLRSLTSQILAEHVVDGALVPGEEVELRVDQVLLQDATGTMACLQLEQLGTAASENVAAEGQDIAAALQQFQALRADRIGIPFAVVYVDHNLLAVDFKNADDHVFLQSFCARYGLHYSRPGNGICHYVHIERFARPGHLLVGADSHTTTSGALG
jgi:aconitate hydratase